jgi:acetolactate synthase-1/2/3 large subunit
VYIARNAAKIWSGRGRFQPRQIPYFPEPAIELLGDLENLVLVEAKTPVSFFGYPETPGLLAPESCAITVLAGLHEDGPASLEAVAEECGAAREVPVFDCEAVTVPADGPLTLENVGRVMAAWLPENTLIAEEMVSSGGQVLEQLRHAAPHEWMPVTGGSIGQGLPVAVGAAVACPERKVLALEADGSAMYTPQALWTMARENLNVLTVIFANGRYRILDVEMRRTGAKGFGEIANNMIDIGRPDLDFVSLARGMGVRATRAATTAEFEKQFREGIAVCGPRLIEAVLK